MKIFAFLTFLTLASAVQSSHAASDQSANQPAPAVVQSAEQGDLSLVNSLRGFLALTPREAIMPVSPVEASRQSIPSVPQVRNKFAYRRHDQNDGTVE